MCRRRLISNYKNEALRSGFNAYPLVSGVETRGERRGGTKSEVRNPEPTPQCGSMSSLDGNGNVAAARSLWAELSLAEMIVRGFCFLFYDQKIQ